MYDGSAVLKLGSNNEGDWPVLNDNNLLIWLEDTVNGNEVYSYDGSRTLKVLTKDLISSPDMNDSGHITWVGANEDILLDFGVYYYDGSTTTRISSNAAALSFPVINNSGHIAWFYNDTMYYYDGSNVTALTYEGGNNDPEPVPIADAGPDKKVVQGSVIMLDGSGSYDHDDAIAFYEWVQTSGPDVLLSNSYSVTAEFTAPSVGLEGAVLTFELKVTNSEGETNIATCSINISGTIQAQTLELKKGWNLVSMWQEPDKNKVENIMASSEGGYKSVWSYDGSNWKVYDPANPDFSDLSNMEYRSGYWLNMDLDSTLVVSGKILEEAIELNAGWNLVGFNSSTEKKISDSMHSVEGKYISVWAYSNGNWLVYDPANPDFSDLNNMVPGFGYWINVSEACVWEQ